MSCPRCGALSDEELTLARALGPMLQAAASAYLSGQTIPIDDPPPALSRTEEKLFSVLFNASPNVVPHEVLLGVGGVIHGMHSLRVTMSNLRLKLGAEYRLEPVYGRGYRMVWDD